MEKTIIKEVKNLVENKVMREFAANFSIEIEEA